MWKTKQIWWIVVAGAALIVTLSHGTTVTYGQPGTGTIRVDGLSGSDSSMCGAEAAPCQSLQRAVNNAGQFGSATVLVAEGTYTYASSVFSACEGNLGVSAVVCVYNRQIVMLGGYPHGNWTQSDPKNHPTIIDGQNQRRGIYVFTDPNQFAGSLRLADVIVQNGVAQGAASGTMDQMSGYGGGLLADLARVELVRVTFRNNLARGGNTTQAAGGAGSGGGVALRTAAAGTSLEQVTFTNNQAIGGSGAQRGGFGIGGGLFTYQTAFSGQYITATNNQSAGGDTNGAGLYGGETGDAQGAGIALQIGSNAVLQYVTVMNNTATGGDAPAGTAAGAFGGGIFSEQATATLRDIVVQNNIAQGGTGLNPTSTQYRGSLAEGGGLMTDKGNVVLDHAMIIANQALGGNGSTTGYGGAAGGGGAYFSSSSGAPNSISIVNSIVADNYAAMGTGSPSAVAGGGGGGITFYYVQPTVQFTTIARNRLNSTAMQGLAINGTPQNGNFYNTIIADHTVPAGMHAVFIQTAGALILNRTLWAGNTFNIYRGSQSGSVTDLNPVTTLSSAGFVSPGAPNYNYHIKKTSPAMNAATGAYPTVDIDYQTRPWFGAPDIGADEYTPLILGGGSIASGRVLLTWWADNTLLPGLASYEISFTCPSGAACPGTLNAGTATQYVVSGLTNGKTYSVLVTAKDGSNQEIDRSNTIQVTPADRFVYLPTIRH
jgi:hypothetical protein